MHLLYNRDQARELDRIAIEERGISGLTLMRRAAEACVRVLMETWSPTETIAVLCGSGNNAGDGFIIAGLLRLRGLDARICLIGNEPSPGSDAEKALEYAHASGITFVGLDEAVLGAELIIDALLGTGASGELRPHFIKAIETANRAPAKILSVDLPSGLSADTGSSAGGCIKADITVTFIGRKIGLYTCDGPHFAGDIRFSDLDVPPDIFEQVPATASFIDYGVEASLMKPRHRNSHKRSHGHVLIIGGDKGMTGAAILAAEAALYTGAGLVTVATQNAAAIVTRLPEVMTLNIKVAEDLKELLAKATVVVIGPGLGLSDWGHDMFSGVLSITQPLIVDADGLNLLASTPFHRDGWVLTPHPGEASRLLDGADVQSDRPTAVRSLVEKYGGTVLLKGSGTLIGYGKMLTLCPYGNPGMSVAGMGDVLSGVIAGLIAQGSSLPEAAMLGAVVHSLAGDYLVDRQGERGLLATELMPEIRRLVNP